jgi:hypothetical protein
LGLNQQRPVGPFLRAPTGAIIYVNTINDEDRLWLLTVMLDMINAKKPRSKTDQ